MKIYQENEVYTFKALGINFDSKTEQHYLLVEDPEGFQFRVRPYRYQIDWAGDFDTVDCVARINEGTGNLWFVQRKLDILEQLYEVGEEYPFFVREQHTDQNGSNYYLIEDNIQEITQRYYTKAKHDIGDCILLTVSGILESPKKDAYLKFEPESAHTAHAKPAEKDKEVIKEFAAERAKVGGSEGQKVEWKTSIAYVAGEIEPNIDKQLSIILKIIASFQNSKGGDLYIGVNNNGVITGIHYDLPHLNSGADTIEQNRKYSQTLDSYKLKIHNAIKDRLGAMSNANVDIRFAKEGDLHYCIVSVKPTLRPVFLDGAALYQRAGNMCQRLRGEEITNFILNREREYKENVEEYVKPIVDNLVMEDKQKDVITIPQPVATIMDKEKKVRWYMQFYENGTWSYSKTRSKTAGIAIEVPIYRDCVNGALLICYDNGHVCRINPSEILAGGRCSKWKPEGKIYKNGLNKGLNVAAVYCCGSRDYLAIFSNGADGVEYAKVHNLEAITERTVLNCQGNQVVKTGTPAGVRYALITADKFHFVSSLVLKDYQTTLTNGFRRKNIQLRATFDMLDKIATSNC